MAVRYGTLGQECPSGTGTTAVYTVPSGYYAIASTINFCNVTASQITFSWHVRPAGAALVDKHYQDKNVLLDPYASIKMSLGSTHDQTDVISVAASAGNALVVTISGTEIGH